MPGDVKEQKNEGVTRCLCRRRTRTMLMTVVFRQANNADLFSTQAILYGGSFKFQELNDPWGWKFVNYTVKGKIA